MSGILVTARRTLGMLRSQYSTAFAMAAFLSVTAIRFSFLIDRAEGGHLDSVAVWALAVAPFLPALAAVLGMDVWSGERRSGRMAALLSVAVRERDFVFGKFLGVWLVLIAATAMSFVLTHVGLWFFVSSALSSVTLRTCALAGLILVVQGALWCAVITWTSAVSCHGAAAACGALLLTVALPRGLWEAVVAWVPQGRMAHADFLLDEHVLDMATGFFSLGGLLAYVLLIFLILFLASKCIAATRFVGRGSRMLRLSTRLVCLLAVACVISGMALVVRLSDRIDLTFDRGYAFSERTCKLLADVSGTIDVSVFMSRKDVEMRMLGRFFRELKVAAQHTGGCRLNVNYVDPTWDFGAAERLVRLGASARTIVFERGRRSVVVPLSDGFDERVCASAIRRIVLPLSRSAVYWTTGHGEIAFDAYNAWGMSDIARDLTREGYSNRRIDLAQSPQVPSDCALIVIAGAKTDFSRAELSALDAYLRHGGRLMMLLNAADQGGAVALLPSWGLRPVVHTWVRASTRTGTDVLVSDFTSHVVGKPLLGSRVVLERPLCFEASGAAESGAGADKIEFSPIARVGLETVIAATERGVGAGTDLAIRPTRIIAIGDASFAANGQLATRANANRDLFLNCVAFLSGTDAIGACGMGLSVLSVGMDNATRLRFLCAIAGVFPLLVLLLLSGITCYRRRRS